ncbi:MAG TPA: hypothetical protein VIM70_22825 [Clostridium sp.]|uniref:hypothetical protein n=1 Tax=Clostridium sp. TaxID=1506 RepID=UPI002F928E55
MSENKDIIDIKTKRKLSIIIIVLSIITISIGIFLASYYSSINKDYSSYKTTLVTNINSINDANKNVAQFNSDETIDVEYAKKQLPIIIIDLSNYKSNISVLEPATKYEKDQENLILALDDNLKIYRQTLSILNNPSGSDVDKSVEALKILKNDCINYYSLIDINNIEITLPETSLSFIDNVLNYSSSAVMARKETDIKSEQDNDFISKTEVLSEDFLNTKTNFYTEVLKVRKKSMSYDELLSLVDVGSAQLVEVQKSFKGLTVPDSAIPTYEAFRILLDANENYLMDFKLALTSEKIQTLSATVAPSKLNALYTSSNELFAKVESSNNNFNKIYTQLKNK